MKRRKPKAPLPSGLRAVRERQKVAAGQVVLNLEGIYRASREQITSILREAPSDEIVKASYMATVKTLVWALAGMGALRKEFANDVPRLAELVATTAFEVVGEMSAPPKSSLIITPFS